MIVMLQDKSRQFSNRALLKRSPPRSFSLSMHSEVYHNAHQNRIFTYSLYIAQILFDVQPIIASKSIGDGSD